MPDHVYKTVEVTGTSTESINRALENGVAKAAETLHGLDWFEVTEVRGYIADGSIAHYQVTAKIGFRLD